MGYHAIHKKESIAEKFRRGHPSHKYYYDIDRAFARLLESRKETQNARAD